MSTQLDGMGFNYSLAACTTGRFKSSKEEQHPLFQCEYCKCKYQNHYGTCPGCGSPHAKVLWLPNQASKAYYAECLYLAY